MNDRITTESISSNIEEIKEDFVLDEKPMSRLIFHAQIHTEGIRGKIIRQRRSSKEDTWMPDKAIDIRSLGKNEGINIELPTKAVKNLYLAIQKLDSLQTQEGVQYGRKNYVVTSFDEVVITDNNKHGYINKIIDAGHSQEFWNSLAKSDPSLTTKLSYLRIQNKRKEVIKELKLRLESNNFLETSGDNSWQKWIYENNWLFGINYKQPIEKTKININGIMPDYLFPTVDGFVDILEIKLPNDKVITEDNNHHGSWKWTSKTNEAIGQVINYLGEIDRLKLEIERSIENQYKNKMSLLKPRAYILIGNSSLWPDSKKEGLRKLNFHLHGIEILTYKDLLDRGEQSIYTIE